MTNETPKATNYRAGYLAVAGEPNVGKSTLVNEVLDAKVSIVSAKPQTTRKRVAGILTTPKFQCILVDPPGRISAQSGLNGFLHEEFMDSVKKADAVLLLLAADQNEKSALELIRLVQAQKKPWSIVVTKGDLLGGTRTPKFFKVLIEEKLPFVTLSVKSSPAEARQIALDLIEMLLPPAPAPLYDEDIYTTQTVREMAAELIRESAFDRLHQEVPYGMAVRITEFKEDLTKSGVLRITAEILLDKENHKGIVIGAGGQTLKAIGTDARLEIEKLIGEKVFLGLQVKVREDWARNPRMMKELGYVFTEN